MPSTGCWNAGFGSVISITIFRGPSPSIMVSMSISRPFPTRGPACWWTISSGGNTGPGRWWVLSATTSRRRRARRAADPLDLDEARLEALRELGICLNYNAYGAQIENLYAAPDTLFRRLRPYADPFEFVTADDDAFRTLRAGYAEDMARVRAVQPEIAEDCYALYILPAEPWARAGERSPSQPARPCIPRRAPTPC